MEVLQWNTLSPAVQVKLLFLLDTGDVTSQDTDYSDDRHVSAPEKARYAFLSVLQDRQHCFNHVTEVLRNRVKHFLEYSFISLSAATLAADLSVRKDDEDLLTLVHACRHLHVEYRYLEDKIKKVQEKLSLTEEEMEGNLFIYSENLRMLRLCDALPACQVTQLLALIMEDKTLREFVAADLEVSAATLQHTKGLKETLFFYLIRTLELNNKLNSIYTNKLKALLDELQDQVVSEEERHVLSEAITSLGDYPGGARPAGYCVVFCVTRGRERAEADIEKVKHVFGRCLGYTVHTVENPDKDKLEECLRTLQKPKFKFYNSIVYWFISHGSEDTLKLANGSTIKRQDIIQDFSKVANFRKKPKIFLMALFKRVPRSMFWVRQRKTMDEMPFFEVPEDCQDITAVYYQMDRLVARAIFIEQDAFFLPDGGSVYVDTVCRLMERHRGHSITQVLERVTNTMHQIFLSCEEKVVGKAKQEVSYESTLQKIFRVP